MILSGSEIVKRHDKGEIYITDFDRTKVNPNSYNLKLHNMLLVYKDNVLDMKKDNEVEVLMIPEEGLLLEPGKLYLGRTEERTVTNTLVPMLEGRSSIGRLGLYIHVTAGFGDVSFDGYWTLELQCVQPLRIYPGVEIGQIYYHTICGEYESNKYNGKYQKNCMVQSSKLYEDFTTKSITHKTIRPDDSVSILGTVSPGIRHRLVETGECAKRTVDISLHGEEDNMFSLGDGVEFFKR